jgi:hypothetical protein
VDEIVKIKYTTAQLIRNKLFLKDAKRDGSADMILSRKLFKFNVNNDF